MIEPTINDATTIAGNSRPAQGNKIVRVAHVKHVAGKARAGGKCKTFLKKVIIWLVWLVAILALAVVGVIGGFLWRDGATWEAEMTQETERTKSEWEERERNGADAADNGHTKVQLWEGGPYWADTNIGAKKPWEPGYYFWWGDTVGYKRQGGAWTGSWVASDGSKSDFSFEEKNTPTCMKSIDELLSEGWITSDNILMREHDAAHVHWGGDWRMPTEQELDDLMNKCNWTRATINGVNGYVVRGRGAYADASIFLPCVGDCGGTSLFHAASEGYYWSSVPSSDYYDAWRLYFNSSGNGTRSSGRIYGRSVRPVQGFTKKRTK